MMILTFNTGKPEILKSYSGGIDTCKNVKDVTLTIGEKWKCIWENGIDFKKSNLQNTQSESRE